MFLGHHARGLPLKGGCLDIASFESVILLLDRGDSPYYLLAPNKSRKFVSVSVRIHMQCGYQQINNYTCSFTGLTRNTIRADVGRLYIFYPCFNKQSVDISFNLSLDGKNVSKSKYPGANCSPTQGDASYNCSKYYAEWALPNIYGELKKQPAMRFISTLKSLTATCHKHFEEALCHVFLPKCENQSRILLCKSSCLEVFKVCGKHILQGDQTGIGLLIQSYFSNYYAEQNMSMEIGNIFNVASNFYCNELPDTECVKTETVTCPSPQDIEHGTHDDNGNTYYVLSTITYRCNSGYILDDNGTATCQYSGEWSRIPKCLVKTSHKDLIITCSIFATFVLLILTAFIIIWKYRKELLALLYVRCGIKFVREREERREYDAYIAYSHEDYDFVKQNILDPLNKYPFKLCIPARDFGVGGFRHQWIMKKVKESKRTIIVLSLNFLKSEYCQSEFVQSHLKLLEDGSFKLLLIAIDDPKTLRRALAEAPDHKLIFEYFSSSTYLAKNDCCYFERLLYQLPKVEGIQNIRA